MQIPCLFIKDEPRFGCRGCLLDCARHFMDIEFILKFVRVLAYHKMNRLHWHLVDDQGWVSGEMDGEIYLLYFLTILLSHRESKLIVTPPSLPSVVNVQMLMVAYTRDSTPRRKSNRLLHWLHRLGSRLYRKSNCQVIVYVFWLPIPNWAAQGVLTLSLVNGVFLKMFTVWEGK